MMRIVLFALVCVAITQVHGSELDDAIKKAIERLDVMSGVAGKIVQRAKSDCTTMKNACASRAEYYTETSKDMQTAANNILKEVAKELTEKAKAGKNPEEVIKCITKEEESAMSSISSLQSKFEADVKSTLKGEVSIVDEQEKQIQKIEEALPGRYKQGVADLKKCTDVSAVHHTLVKLEGEYTQIMLDCDEMMKKIVHVVIDLDQKLRPLTDTYSHAVEVARKQGVKKMVECLPH